MSQRATSLGPNPSSFWLFFFGGGGLLFCLLSSNLKTKKKSLVSPQEEENCAYFSVSPIVSAYLFSLPLFTISLYIYIYLSLSLSPSLFLYLSFSISLSLSLIFCSLPFFFLSSFLFSSFPSSLFSCLASLLFLKRTSSTIEFHVKGFFEHPFLVLASCEIFCFQIPLLSLYFF